jgi:hypothetical protein
MQGANQVKSLLESASIAPTAAAAEALKKQASDLTASLTSNISAGGINMGDLSKMVSPEMIANVAGGNPLALASKLGLVKKSGLKLCGIELPALSLPDLPSLGDIRGAIPSISFSAPSFDLSALTNLIKSMGASLSFGLKLPCM